MVVLVKILQVILALSLLIVIHEFGHFIFARLFRIRVEKFYLFFPPAIFRYKPRRSETEFGIGCIPLGGFCKISGMIDESMDRDTMAAEPQPWEFRTKPAWQRFFVMIGGVLFNFIFAVILYCAILFVWGEEYLRNEDAVYGIQASELAEQMGFRTGDRILAFDGEPVEDFAKLQVELVRSQAKTATVLRSGDTLTLTLDPRQMPAVLNTPGMFAPLVPVAVASVPDTSLNASAGLCPGDRFLQVGDIPVSVYPDLEPALARYRGRTVDVLFRRGADTVAVPLRVNALGKIQVLLQGDVSEFRITRREYSLAESVPAGIRLTFSTIGDYLQELKLILTPRTEAYKSVGSFIAIGSIFPSVWNWQAFWNITAWLSIMLAVLNLLPIPALDGGHVLFVLFEMITGRKPSDKFLEYAQMVGMVLLLSLIVLAFSNDIVRLFR